MIAELNKERKKQARITDLKLEPFQKLYRQLKGLGDGIEWKHFDENLYI